MPPKNSVSVKSNKIYSKIITGFCILIAIGTAYYFYTNHESKSSLIDTYIQITPIAGLDENVSRGGADIVSASDRASFKNDFIKAAHIIKRAKGDYNLAISLLQNITTSKNKYQQESLWLKALAHAKLNENKLAIKELNKLQAISSYQKDKIKKLILHLKS